VRTARSQAEYAARCSVQEREYRKTQEDTSGLPSAFTCRRVLAWLATQLCSSLTMRFASSWSTLLRIWRSFFASSFLPSRESLRFSRPRRRLSFPRCFCVTPRPCNKRSIAPTYLQFHAYVSPFYCAVHRLIAPFVSVLAVEIRRPTESL